jgi:hypothetical protein
LSFMLKAETIQNPCPPHISICGKPQVQEA